MIAVIFAQAGSEGAWAQTIDGGRAQTIGHPYGGLPAPQQLPSPPAKPKSTESPSRGGPGSRGTPDAAPTTIAPKWLVTPYASVREAFTDNVRLERNGTHDFITSITPGIAVEGRTRRWQTAIDGNVTYDIHARASDLDGYRYNLYSNGLGEIADDLLFVDIRTSISSETVSANGGVSGFDRRLPGNQVQVINTSISPYLTRRFGGWATGELRYRASVLEYSDANTNSQTSTPTSTGVTPVALDGIVTNEISANLKAGPRFNVFRWAIDGSASKSEYAADRTVERTSGTLTGEYAVMRELALLARVGGDGYDDSAASSTSDNFHPSWRLGTRATPGPKTDFLIEAGERFGGAYWATELRYRITGAMTLSASHDRSLGTQQDLSSNGLNQLIRDDRGRLVDPLTGSVTNPNATPFDFVGQSFALERSRVGVNGIFGRNSYDISMGYDQRTVGATSFDESGLRTQDVLLFRGSLGRQLSRRSDASIFFSMGKTDDSLATGSYDILHAGAAYNYAFSPTLRGSLAYRFYRLSNEIGTSYDENAVLVSARKNF